MLDMAGIEQPDTYTVGQIRAARAPAVEPSPIDTAGLGWHQRLNPLLRIVVLEGAQAGAWITVFDMTPVEAVRRAAMAAAGYSSTHPRVIGMGVDVSDERVLCRGFAVLRG